MNIGQISKRYFTNIFRNLFKANPLNSHSAPCATILTLEQVNRFLKPCENYTKNVWLENARTSRSLRLPNSSSLPITSISIIPPTATFALVKDTIPFSVIGNDFFVANSFSLRIAERLPQDNLLASENLFPKAFESTFFLPLADTNNT